VVDEEVLVPEVEEVLVPEVEEALVPEVEELEDVLDPNEHAVDPLGPVVPVDPDGPVGPDPPELGGVDAVAAEALANAPTAQPATISFATRTVCSLSQACGVSCRAGAERARASHGFTVRFAPGTGSPAPRIRQSAD
jgi:hypothetical protein